MATDVNLVADAEIEIDNGELPIPRFHVWEQRRIEYLDASKGVTLQVGKV
jgi:hypothetical protein